MTFTFRLIAELPSFVKHANTSYADKHTPQQRDFIESNWKKILIDYKEKKNLPYDPYNGAIVSSYIHKGKGNAPIKMVWRDFASHLASGKDSSMRSIYSLGVSIVIKTKDGKYVVGSRDLTTTSEGNHPAQFAAGYVERYEKNEANPEEQEKRFKEIDNIEKLQAFVIERAIKEGKEEIYGEMEIKNPVLIGAVLETKKWPSKKTGYKEIDNLQGFVVLAETDLTSEQIVANRNPQNTRDMSIEMSELAFVEEEEFLQMTEDSKVKLPSNGEQKFVSSHEIIPAVVKAWKEEKSRLDISIV